MFTAQTNTGIETSNSYVTVAYADEYNSLRLNTTWSGSTAEKEAALIISTDLVENKFGGRFKGTSTTVSGLHFPIVTGSAYYQDGLPIIDVPIKLKNAIVEYALLSMSESLYPETDSGLTGRSYSVGSISESVSYGSSGSSSYKSHQKADGLIYCLLKETRSDRA